MSDFKGKMHQNPISVGLCPKSRWGVYSTLPDPVAKFKGATSNGRGWKGMEREGRVGREEGIIREKERKGEERNERGREGDVVESKNA